MNLIIAVSQDGPVYFYCQAKIAKKVHQNLADEELKKKFGVTQAEKVGYERYDGKEESK